MNFVMGGDKVVNLLKVTPNRYHVRLFISSNPSIFMFTKTSKMRYPYLPAALLLALSGCLPSGNSNHHDPIESTNITHARTEIDWAGTYQGMLPCAPGCDGLATMLVLYPDGKYSLRTRKLGQDIKDKIKNGNFVWISNGNEIKLDTSTESGVINVLRVGRRGVLLINKHGMAFTDAEDKPLLLNKTGKVPEPQPTI